MKSISAFCILIATVLTTAGTTQAQTSDSTMQALLAEVRQLRLALERSAVVAPRIQVTLQRMQLQQDSVSRASRQLEDLRDQLAKSAAVEADMAVHIKDVEARSAQEQDSARRKAMEDEVKQFKSRLEQKTDQQTMNDAQQRARESELVGRLQTEQAKLNELNDRLNTLERMLEPPRE
jgi:hypothetical protein